VLRYVTNGREQNSSTSSDDRNHNLGCGGFKEPLKNPFLALIQPIYHQPTAKGGRPPFPLEMMLRIHLLQQWVTLSEP
jgi:IS5 family transposase